jgi:hypothetical protein
VWVKFDPMSFPKIRNKKFIRQWLPHRVVRVITPTTYSVTAVEPGRGHGKTSTVHVNRIKRRWREEQRRGEKKKRKQRQLRRMKGRVRAGKEKERRQKTKKRDSPRRAERGGSRSARGARGDARGEAGGQADARAGKRERSDTLIRDCLRRGCHSSTEGAEAKN